MKTEAFIELLATTGEQVARHLGTGVAYVVVAYNASENEYHVWVPEHFETSKLPDFMKEAVRAVTTPEQVVKTRG